MTKGGDSSKIAGSAGALVVCGLSAAIATGKIDWQNIQIAPYSLAHIAGTKSPVVHVTAIGADHRLDDQFALAIADFYKGLLDGQESLGQEFEAIWDANVENLYEA